MPIGYAIYLSLFRQEPIGGNAFVGLSNYKLALTDPQLRAPVTTSYDYDAPLDEAGNPTAKYWAFREVLAR